MGSQLSEYLITAGKVGAAAGAVVGTAVGGAKVSDTWLAPQPDSGAPPPRR